MAALALALGGGALGVGCGEEEKPNGSAGGAGGDGGTGGTGGEGGPCGLEICAPQGEECVTDPDTGSKSCQCDPDGEACADGYICDPSDRRCRELPPPARELLSCTQPNAVEGDLQCVAFQSGSAFWLRPCATGDDCVVAGTFCPAEFGTGFTAFCIPNQCGSEDGYSEGDNPLPLNGDTFGTCSPNGRDGNPPTGLVGTCIPNENEPNEGSCHVNGTSTTTCRDRAPGAFDPAHHCAPGFGCDTRYYVPRLNGVTCNVDADCENPSFTCEHNMCVIKKCTADSECAEDAYCGTDGYCTLMGTCVEVCNAGTLGEDAGPFAGCSDPEKICNRPRGVSTPLNSERIFGECTDPECTEDDQCNGDFVCVDGRCRLPEPDPECTEDDLSKCDEGQICVDGKCTDDVECTEDDLSNCNEGQICVDGKCTDDPTCEGGLELCGEDCVDLQTSDDHCGECNNACGEAESCVAGECTEDEPGDEEEE